MAIISETHMRGVGFEGSGLMVGECQGCSFCGL